MSAAEFLVLLVQIWGAVGVCVAVGFLTFGLGQIDEDARGAIAFRPLLIPGILVIWPLVLWRWWVLVAGRDQWALRHAPPRQSHRIIAVILAVLVTVTLLTAFSIRQSPPRDSVPVLLERGTGQ